MAAEKSIFLDSLRWQRFTLLVLVCLAVFRVTPSSTETELKFTKTPPRILYVSNGSAAKLDWEYYLKSSSKRYEIEITWSLYNPDESNMPIAFQYHAPWDSFLKVYNTRYQPRLSAENNGFNTTLVVGNMSREDEGVFGCQVLVREDSYISKYVRSTIQVVVTDRPEFVAVPSRVYTIPEGQDLNVPCSARGSPNPNITWLWWTGGKSVVVASGVGIAILSMRGVHRDQGGVYECQASNNPNEQSLVLQTRIRVQYILFPPQNTTVQAGEEISLQCILGPNESSLITWHRPTGAGRIRSNGCSYGNQILLIPEAKESDSGVYMCTATKVHDGKLMTVSASAHVIVKGPPNSPLVRQFPSNTSVTLRWQMHYSQHSPVTQYTIYRRVMRDCDVTLPWAQVANVTTALEYEVLGLKPGVTYQFIVTSWNEFGESEKKDSQALGVRLGIARDNVTGDNVSLYPTSPRVWQARLSSDQSTITIMWAAVTNLHSPITMYTLYRRVLTSGDITSSWRQLVNITVPADLEYNFTDVEPEVTYQFVVTSWNRFGESEIDESKILEIRIVANISRPGNKENNHFDHEDKVPVTPVKQDCHTFLVVTAVSVLANMVLLVVLVVFIFRINKLAVNIKASQSGLKGPSFPSNPNNYTPVQSHQTRQTSRDDHYTLQEEHSFREPLPSLPIDVEEVPLTKIEPRQASAIKRKRGSMSSLSSAGSSQCSLNEQSPLTSDREIYEPMRTTNEEPV
ncbi:protein sidekick isoform X1 [Nematostella vectensis]|uniref:protein sidekick isoform X1 n=1 Tax=Nematostella vectensis TaxID=45351 RepID=UPI002076E11E|nr:protein sidekick isoform X1 [Nematostella vectensis]XP_048585884.1 protein sidekick isoform X1 [Nematostella vectensis]XP_048585885.1 protein sidekick isoform X1 [Nematostella vectensis]XP_048585886.1 protein sidekick isoform X1 [Nematostella vectensis]